MKLRIYGIAVLTITGLAVLPACTQRDRDQARTEQDQEQIVSEQVTPNEGDLSGSVAKRDEAVVKGQQEVVTKETKTLNEKVPTVVTGQEKLDVNRMNRDDFVALGLNRTVAERVIQYRDKNGPFTSIDQLSQIQGIDQSWLSRYRDRFAFVSEGQDTGRAGEAGNY